LEIHELPFSTVYVKLKTSLIHWAVLIELPLVTNRKTDKKTDTGPQLIPRWHSVARIKSCYANECKKLQFIHTVNGDGSKTAKIIKRQC